MFGDKISLMDWIVSHKIYYDKIIWTFFVSNIFLS